jgi:hypothetical protein
MEKGAKVKFMKLSDYELGETLGTGIIIFPLTFLINIYSHYINRFIRSCSHFQKQTYFQLRCDENNEKN